MRIEKIKETLDAILSIILIGCVVTRVLHWWSVPIDVPIPLVGTSIMYLVWVGISVKFHKWFK